MNRSQEADTIRHLIFGLLGVACIFMAGCASPTAPTARQVVALQIHVDQPVHYVVPSRSVNFLAYAVDNRGAYSDVTSQVSWASTDSEVFSIRQGVAVTATAMTPGEARILASYHGVSDALALTVRPWQDYEDSFLRLQFSTVLHAGQSASATAYLNGLDQDVTTVATWRSSNPQVLVVDQSGRVTALQPGTATIAVSYNGLTDDCVVSVPPIVR